MIDLNATQAAIRAGYSEKTANEIGTQNLAKLSIRSYIDERMKSKTTALIASQDEVLEYLTGVLRGEEKGTVLVGQGQGFQIVSKETPTVSEWTKAAELLGKRYRLFMDVTELEVKTPTFVEDVPEDD